jgi:hypothetical protein
MPLFGPTLQTKIQFIGGSELEKVMANSYENPRERWPIPGDVGHLNLHLSLGERHRAAS